MSRSSSPDRWGVASAVYAAKAELVTQPPAEDLVCWMHEESSLSTPGSNVFDNGAGSGIATVAVYT